MRKSLNQGQSILEYTLLLAAIIAVILAVLFGNLKGNFEKVYKKTGSAAEQTETTANVGVFSGANDTGTTTPAAT